MSFASSSTAFDSTSPTRLPFSRGAARRCCVEGIRIMAAHPKRKYTLEEYFELERSTNERFEYWNGEVFSMSGVSEQHDQIEGNAYLNLRLALRGRERRVFLANMRIKVPSLPPYRYGDVSVACNEPI